MILKLKFYNNGDVDFDIDIDVDVDVDVDIDVDIREIKHDVYGKRQTTR